MVLIELKEDSQWNTEMNSAGSKLVVVDFTASWCGPCRTIGPFFNELSSTFPGALFLKVDVDQCSGTAESQGVSAMPTFIFYRNKVKIDRLQGANQDKLREKVQLHYGTNVILLNKNIKI